MRNLFLLFVMGLLFAGCQKETPLTKVDNCEDLKQGIILDSFLLVKSAINNYIDKLPSNLHTPDDLTRLTEYISKYCTSAVVFCYGCIYSFPPQSEIVISVDSAGTIIKRVIDITGHPNEKMRFRNMHEF